MCVRKSLKSLHPNLERQSAEGSLWTYPVLIFFPGTTVMQDTWTRCAIDLNTWSIHNSSVQYLPRKPKIPEPEHDIFQTRESIAKGFWLDRAHEVSVIHPELWSQQRIFDPASFTTLFCPDKLLFLNESCNKKFRPDATAPANRSFPC